MADSEGWNFSLLVRLLRMYVAVPGSYSYCMPQRKQASASTDRRAVVRYTEKAAAREKSVLLRMKERAIRARVKASEREKESFPPKSSFKSDQVRMPGFVGMLKDGQRDLAARAKDIVRGGNADK